MCNLVYLWYVCVNLCKLHKICTGVWVCVLYIFANICIFSQIYDTYNIFIHFVHILDETIHICVCLHPLLIITACVWDFVQLWAWVIVLVWMHECVLVVNVSLLSGCMYIRNFIFSGCHGTNCNKMLTFNDHGSVLLKTWIFPITRITGIRYVSLLTDRNFVFVCTYKLF